MPTGALKNVLFATVLALILTRSVLLPSDKQERIRFFTRQLEFDYLAWTLDAIGVKFSQSALGIQGFMGDAAGVALVENYIQLVREIQVAERDLEEIYTDPAIQDPASSGTELRLRLEDLYRQRVAAAPLAESILQTQVALVAADLGLVLGGQPIPPILYHVTPAPLALIVSPRSEISQEANISILPDLTLEDQIALEQRVAEGLDRSTLVVEVGGIGVYPSLVTQTSNLNFLVEVVAHEWIHNYLTLRPLGFAYTGSGELRTMNETVAALAGREIGALVIERFYPAQVPPPPAPAAEASESPVPPAIPQFDFRAEMRVTRLQVDELLAQGRIHQAEAFMEERRQFFWENGYHLRRLNQAYFAFYGAYADQPGGAAGEDPVGTAVRLLRERSSSLKDFLRVIAAMSSFGELKDYLNE